MNDAIKYNVPDDKGKGYKVKVEKNELKGNLPVPKGGWPSKKKPSLQHHSTVTEYSPYAGDLSLNTNEYNDLLKLGCYPLDSE